MATTVLPLADITNDELRVIVTEHFRDVLREAGLEQELLDLQEELELGSEMVQFIPREIEGQCVQWVIVFNRTTERPSIQFITWFGEYTENDRKIDAPRLMVVDQLPLAFRSIGIEIPTTPPYGKPEQRKLVTDMLAHALLKGICSVKAMLN